MNLRTTLSAVALLLLAVYAALFTGCAAPQAATLDMAPFDRTLTTGERVQLTVTRHFPGGPIENVSSRVTYSTSDPAIATVENGVLTARTQPGSVTVKATDTNSDATAAVTFIVVSARITSIEVSPTPATVMRRGTTQQFRARAIFSDGTEREVTKEVSWSSVNAAAAVVGDSPIDKGVVSAVAAGDTTILATDGVTRVQGRSIVFVTGDTPQLKAIVVTPNPGVIAVGKPTQFSALGVLSDGTTRDITREVSWSSSRVDLATIDGVGVATGASAGDVTVSAAGPEPSSSVRGSAAAKVIP